MKGGDSMSANGYSIYLLCDNGSIYTSDPYDVINQNNKYPYLSLTDIDGLNPNRNSTEIFNGKIYYSTDQKITLTATFHNVINMMATLNNIKEHLFLIAIATSPEKDEIYTKKAIVSSLDYNNASYLNGNQSKLTISTTGNWICGDFGHQGNGLWSSNPKLDFRSQATVEQGLLIQPTSDNIKINDTSLDLTQVPLNLDNDEKIFITEHGMIYREKHQDLLNIGDFLINTNANTTALTKLLYTNGFELGGINAGFLMHIKSKPNDETTNTTRIEDDYSHMLSYIKQYQVTNPAKIAGAKFIAKAYLGRRDFI